MKHPVRVLVLMVLWLAAVPAAAQRGIDIETFRPTFDGYGLFTVERAATGRPWDVGFKLWSDYARTPLSLRIKTEVGGQALDRAILDYQVAAHLGAHLSLADWAEIALVVPVSAQTYTAAYGSNAPRRVGGLPGQVDVLRPTGFYVADARTNVPPPNAAPLDTRIALKLATRRLGPVGLGLILGGTIPFGDDTAFLGDRGFTFRPVGIIDFTPFRGFVAAVNVGYVLRRHTVVLDPYDVVGGCPPPGGPQRTCPATLLEVDDELTYNVGLGYRITPVVGLVAEVYGLVPLLLPGNPPDRGPGPRDHVLDVLGGLQLYPKGSFQIVVGAGGGVLESHRRDAFRLFAGITWTPSAGGRAGGGSDADGDGIPDALDRCPQRAEDLDGFEDGDGCPDLDNDRDGILDTSDRCPNDAEDRDGFEDDDGCPDPDNDNDGILDGVDRCPGEPEDRDGFRDEDGCPDPDNDNDGIPDTIDRCPNEPETFNAFQDEDGCPDTPGGGRPRGEVNPAPPGPPPGERRTNQGQP
ncbi:MAG TPA: thrombospondin type 3 repeat-containing protein [Polyangia bacterium]|nr:thrombospondin type 3 repeat-containing protein [Polyangia bacterium]